MATAEQRAETLQLIDRYIASAEDAAALRGLDLERDPKTGKYSLTMRHRVYGDVNARGMTEKATFAIALMLSVVAADAIKNSRETGYGTEDFGGEL